MALATQEAIRDRVYSLIESPTPSLLATPKFLRYRNEGGADFQAWSEANPASSLRRFQVREVGDDDPPDVSNSDLEAVELKLQITVAYPQTHRYGSANAMDRDDVMNADWLKINAAIGMYGRGNFSSTHDCTPLGAVKSRDTGSKVDFLVVTARYRYQRLTGA